VYICPAGEKLTYHYTNEEDGRVLRRYWTGAYQNLRHQGPLHIRQGTPASPDGQHKHILEAVQRRPDEHPEKMRQRRETAEHLFGTIKARMDATHFLMKTLKRVRTEMALHVLAYNLTRVMNIFGIAPLIAAMRA
jgi:Transposase DDE domain